MVIALEMYRSVSRTLTNRALGGRVPFVQAKAMPLRLANLDGVRADKPDFAPLRPRLSGICGSDLGAITGQTSLYFSAVVSMPFVPGHEVVADLAADCGDLAKGTRVVLDPILACAARGLEPCAACAEGRTNVCSRITVGQLKPGLQTGFCSSTGGGWSEQLVAHRSQLYAVPDAYTDEQAVLVEPLACAVHTALRAAPTPGARVLVSGAGSVGLLATFALRQLTEAGEIIVVAKHGHQRELARDLGATEVVSPSEVLRRVRRVTGAFQLDPQVPSGLASSYLLGGVDLSVDAVGSRASLETALHATRAGGRVVLSGMPSRADLSAAWFRELEVVGTYASAAREPHGRSAFDTALELAGSPEIARLAEGVATYPLQRWREAIDHAQSAGRLGTVKVAFDPRKRG